MGTEVEPLHEILTKIFKIQKEELQFDISNPTHTNDFPQHFVYIVKPKSDKRLKLELKEDEEAEILQKDKAVKVFELNRINSFKANFFNFDEKRLPTLVFENFDFPDIYLSNDSKTDNDYYPIIFSHCSINSICSIANNEILQPILFERCEIKNVQLDNSTFTSELSFRTCQFEKNTSFVNSTFQNNVYFNNSIFKNYVDFHECEFKQNASFNNSIFKDCVDFGECEFQKKASFYGVSFEKTPNFSQVIFKGDLNIVNTNLNFDFEDLELRIKKEFEEYNKNKKKTKALQNFANDFRDSFRTFKGALVASHNVLDALDFHRVELYCKEIELKAKWNEKHIEASNEIEMRKNTLKFKEKIDYLLLCFYRKLCEHHTDFLRVFNNLILLIALYVVFFYICIDDYNFLNDNKSIMQLRIIELVNEYIQEHIILLGRLIILLIIGGFIYMLFLVFKGISHIKLIIMTSLKTFAKDIGILLVILMICCVFTPLKEFDKVDLFNVCFFYLFIAFYLWLIFLNTSFLRYILICIAYIVLCIGIGVNIILINPLIGKFIDDNSISMNSSLLVVTFAYTILMILVLFSLQKTARKNSIIPS